MQLPGTIPEGCNTKLAPIVSSGRAAAIICKRWFAHYQRLPDAVVVEGPKAGGHLGFKAEDLEKEEFQIENLVRDVCRAVRPFEEKHSVKIPVIAAGGIYSGADIYNIMQAGASGVQMGTRFVATEECDASDAFKQAYLDASREDVVIINSPVGMPGRALAGKFVSKVAAGEKQPKNCIYHCLRPCTYPDTPYCISMALMNAKRGYLDAGFVFCGENVWRIDRIMKVQELIDELVDGYREAAG
jgi:nitronate monooxygenase